MYDAGELSRIMVSAIGRPNCDRSCGDVNISDSTDKTPSDLHVISSVIVTTLSE
jgi:hypothetical protein